MGKMFAYILSVKIFKASESLAVKENQNDDYFSIRKTPGLIAVYLAVADLMTFEL